MIYSIVIVVAMSSDVWWRTIRCMMLYDAVCALTIEEWLFSLSLASHWSLYLLENGWLSISLAGTRCKDIKMIQDAIMLNDRSGIHVYICPQQKLVLEGLVHFICLWIVAKVHSSCPISSHHLSIRPPHCPSPGRSSLMASNDCLLRLRQRQSNEHVEELCVFDFSMFFLACTRFAALMFWFAIFQYFS